MKQEPIAQLVDKLCQSSRRNFHNIYDYVQWPERVDPDREWFMSPELCSLHGTELWESLDGADRSRLAFYEAINFFSLNIRGESALMQGLAERLYGPRSQAISPYLHHFLDEENKHCVLFGTFCERYAGKVYPDRKIIKTSAGAESVQNDFLFFAKVLIFEELVDGYNLQMSKDERLHPIAVAINRNHHIEEARHLAFGRRVCADLWQEESAKWSAEQRADTALYLERFLETSWREYYNPEVYRDAGVVGAGAEAIGLSDPWGVQRFGWEHAASVARRAKFTAGCRKFFTQNGIWAEEIMS